MIKKIISQIRLPLFSIALLFSFICLSASMAKAQSYGLTGFDYSVESGIVVGTHETYLDYNDAQYYYASVDGWLLNYGNDETLHTYQQVDYQGTDAYYDAIVQTYGSVQRGKIYATYSVHSVIARYTYYQYFQDPDGFSNGYTNSGQPTYNFSYSSPAFTVYQRIPVAATGIFVWLPNITGLSVSTAEVGTTKEVEILGKYIGEHSNIAPVVTVSGGGVTATVNRIIPGEGVVVNIQVAADAAPGERQLSLQSGTAPNRVPSNSVPFTITRTQPNITSISPDAAMAGNTYVVQFRGTFGPNPTVQVSGTGVTASYRDALPDGFEANFQIDENAPRGDRQVTVTNSGLTSNAVTFRVGDRSPVITGMSRQQGELGEILSVTITGQDFGLNPLIQLDGTGIVPTIQTQSSTQIVVTFAIGDQTYEGQRGVKVKSFGIAGTGFTTSPGASDTSNAVPFNVLAGPSVDLPEIGSVENQAVREFSVTARNTNGTQTHLTIENPSDTTMGQASFSQNESEIVLNGDKTKTIRIKGVVGSKDNNNIKLKAAYGNNKHKEKSFSVSWVEFLKKEDCDGFDDLETHPPVTNPPTPPAQFPTNYLLVGQNVTRQIKARIRPSNASGNFRLESGTPNTFTVSPATVTSTSDVEISVTALPNSPTSNYDLKAIANQPGTIEAASFMVILIRPRIVKNVVQWKIIEENDDVQDVPVGQGSPNRVAFIILPGPNGVIDSVAGGDDFLGYGPPGSYPPEYRKDYRRLRRAFTGENGIVETVVSGDDVIYTPPAGTVTGQYKYDPNEPYIPFNPLTVGNGMPHGACVSSGANKELDTNKDGDDEYDVDLSTNPNLPFINSGANGRCQTRANATDVPSGTPNSAADLTAYVNDVIWGRQANVFVDVRTTIREEKVNFDFNRDGKLKTPHDNIDRDEYEAIFNAFNSGRHPGDPIDLYYIGMPYAPYVNSQGETVTAVAATENNGGVGGNAGIFGSQGIGISVAAHELGHAFGAHDHYDSQYLGYVMYGYTQPGSPCRVGKIDWDDVNKPTP